jgi:cysteine-rich repeat protein
MDTLDDNEACDDGNNLAGDNCSPTCTIEIDPQICPAGFNCPQ